MVLFSSACLAAWRVIDCRLQQTERYGLYGMPFLSQCLRRLFVFESVEEVGEAKY